MSLKNVINEIRKIVDQALLELNYDYIKYDISEPPKSEFGDLTTNVAFLIGKRNGKSPYIIAQELVYHSINYQIKNIKKYSLVQNAEAHSSGHINFKINYDNFNKFILEIVKQDRALFPDLGKNTRITIEHTSVNPNKALHIGHLRNVVLGDSLHRLFKSTNHQVVVFNYIDDSGVQIADLIVAFKFAGFNSENIDKSIKFDQYCGDIYVKINELYKTNLDLLDKRKLVIKEIEKGNTEIAEFTNYIVEKIVKQQLLTCWRIKARYDLLINESQILLSELWKNTFNLLKDNNIIYFSTEGKNINCWLIKDENNEEKVIVRSDQTATYIAKDISFAIWKLKLVKDPFIYKQFSIQWDNSILWETLLIPTSKDRVINKDNKLFLLEQKPTIVITIIDSRQSRLQKIITNIIDKVDKTNTKKYVYLGYEAVVLSNETVQSIGFEFEKINKKIMHMSGRKGIFINADIILDELYKKAYHEVKKRNPAWNDDIIDKIAEGIAVSAIRYSIIKQDLDKMITFDMKEALNLDGDTSLYLQYSYVRAIRILEKSNGFLSNLSRIETNSDINLNILNHKIEIELIKEISKFSMVIEEAVFNLNPKVIAKYANKLSTKFNSFYESLPVLCDDRFLKISRLLLVKVFVIVLTNLFDLLGIQTFSRI